MGGVKRRGEGVSVSPRGFLKATVKNLSFVSSNWRDEYDFSRPEEGTCMCLQGEPSYWNEGMG